MRSLRTNLLVGLIVPLTAMAMLAGVAAYFLDRRDVDLSLDGQLRQLALNVGDTDVPVRARNGNGVSIDREDEFVVAIWDSAGMLRASDPTYSVPRPAATGYVDLSEGGEDWRAYAAVTPQRTIEVAQRVVVREEFAADSAVRAVLPVALLVPLSWILVGWVVGSALRPLRAVTDELRGWSKARTHRLSVSGVPDEIHPLVAATNDLVTQLQGQIEFREAFISDAAHELRTPLTALRLQARNLAEQAHAPETAVLAAEMESGVRRMSEMVAKLLQLARADASGPVPPLQTVDLRQAIAGSLQGLIYLAAEKDIDLGVEGDAAVQVLGDPDELNALIVNLVDNAIRYSPKGAAVDLKVEQADGRVLLEVRDMGPGIPEEAQERVFSRFVRLAPAETEGSGLGLPIVRAIAERCGAVVALANRTDRSGLIARVWFAPAASATPA